MLWSCTGHSCKILLHTENNFLQAVSDSHASEIETSLQAEQLQLCPTALESLVAVFFFFLIKMKTSIVLLLE